MLNIKYASCMCSENKFKELFGNSENKPAQQVQKYHRTMVNGLYMCDGVNIKALSMLPINETNCNRKYIKKSKENVNGLQILYISILNIKVIKRLHSLIYGFILGLKNIKNEDILIVDVLNISFCLGITLAAKINNVYIIGIITDIPDILFGNRGTLSARLGNCIISTCNAYLLLTEAMNEKVNNKCEKPYVVIEGQVDDNMMNDLKTLPVKYTKKTCMYTGSLNKIHGIQYMVEGFIDANIENSELRLYGDGDFVPEIIKISNEHPNIIYEGVKLNSYIVKEQKRATLLINPRPTNEEFAKYSFPSKNMEYMASGTPILTTCLPGMPKEYYPYVFLLEEENKEGMCKSLTKILNEKPELLLKKGKEALEYVLRNKTGRIQAQKIIEMINNERKHEIEKKAGFN